MGVAGINSFFFSFSFVFVDQKMGRQAGRQEADQVTNEEQTQHIIATRLSFKGKLGEWGH